jgi:chemotaxis protein MotA
VNKTLIGGLAVALVGLALGLYLEGGRLGQILQPTAAIIVFGGTLGAVMVQFPSSVLYDAARQLRNLLGANEDPAPRLIQLLRGLAAAALGKGLLSLDAELTHIQDPFLKKALTYAVDGVPPEELRRRMELEMDIVAEREAVVPKVFESAGGFAPTIGILGAVVGLIQVMQRLENIEQVGKGIAVAFVATLYGVGLANLVLLPCAGRLRLLMRRRQILRELIVDGVIAIVERNGPVNMEIKLAAYREGAASSVGRRKRAAA